MRTDCSAKYGGLQRRWQLVMNNTEAQKAKLNPFSWNLDTAIVVLALTAIAAHMMLRFSAVGQPLLLYWPRHEWPLLLALFFGGVPLLLVLLKRLLKRDFGADILGRAVNFYGYPPR